MSFQARGLALECLVEAGVVVQVSIGRRNRAFEANELADAFTAFERWLASPKGETRTSSGGAQGTSPTAIGTRL